MVGFHGTSAPGNSQICQDIRKYNVGAVILFDYNPVEDRYIPCKEAGLAFCRGDILHIVHQDDANWWQARKEGDTNMRAGLIPAKQLQER